MNDIVKEALNAVRTYEVSFCKFISPNDSGETGGHQAGIYVPKSAIAILFNEPGIRGKNKEKESELTWENGEKVKCRFIYYGQGTRNEYRITRLGRSFNVGDLVIIVKRTESEYLGFVLSNEEDAKTFLEELDLKREHTNDLIPASPYERKTVNFKPRARLLLQLGDQLIKNESIALVELVKNSYDADAKIVTIYMEKPDDLNKGVIIIEDDGFGMSADVVENVWLEPGSDFKSKQIEKMETTPKYKRLPIGEKGIGRFGVHKLGNVIEMTTKAAEFKEVFVRIDWNEFNNYKYLEQVPISMIERDRPQLFKEGRTGTNIVISSLRKKWERGIAREVKRSITALASPFENNDSFKPVFDIVDKPGWFDGLLKWEDIKHYSLFYFRVEIEADSIVDFKYKFSPWPTMTKLRDREVGMSDKIVSSLKRLKYLDDRKDAPISLSAYRIGKVLFEGYIFDLDTFILKLGVTDKKGFKDYMRSNGGIKVYRNGLRVYDYGEPENDWLGLDYRRFQQPTKALSNNLVLGAVYLDRQSSLDLVEKTNREGFIENDAYKAFKNAVIYALDLVETLRMHDKIRLKEFYGATPKSEPVIYLLSEARQYIEEHVKEVPVKNQIIKYISKIEVDYKRIQENLLRAAGAGLSMSVVVHEVEKITFEISKVLKSEKASPRVLSLVQHLSSLIDGYAEIIRNSSSESENLIEILDQAIFNTEYRLKAHRLQLVRAYQEFSGTKRVKIAKNLLIGSIMNVLDNAIYWLDQKELGMIEHAEGKYEKKLYINLAENADEIFIVFADNGTGFVIPTQDIVEPFVSAKPGGIGLGLHIASEVMSAQGGRLIFPEAGDFEIPKEYHDGATVVFAIKK